MRKYRRSFVGRIGQPGPPSNHQRTLCRRAASISPIGSLNTGWALKVDGVIRRTSPSLLPLGAYVDTILAGADEANADNIARAIEARPWPTYEERMAVFSPAGPWKPSRDRFTPQASPKFGRADL